MFDAKLLWYIIISLAVLTAINQYVKASNPELAKFLNFEFLMFPMGMMAMMILMRGFGFVEGLQAGFNDGLKEGYRQALNGGCD